MKKKITFLFLILLKTIKPEITILNPLTLFQKIKNKKNENYLDYTLLLYSEIDYIKTQKIKIILPPSENSKGCKNLYKKRRKFSKMKYAFLLEEGNCDLQIKSKNTKLGGGSFVIIYNRDEDNIIINNFFENENKNSDNKKNFFDNINLFHNKNFLDNKNFFDFKNLAMSFQISVKDADLIINEIKKNKEVILNLNFGLEVEKSDKVEISFFFIVNKIEDYFYFDFLEFYFEIFGENIFFKPVYFLEDLRESPNLHKNCFFENNYCVQFREKDYEFKEYENEIFKQICIFETFNKNLTEKKYYFKYMKLFKKNCLLKKEYDHLEICSKKINDLVLKKEEILKLSICYNKKISLDNLESSFFRDYQLENNQKIKKTPSIKINKKKILGIFTKLSILTAICSAYKEKPKNCEIYYKKFKNYYIFGFEFYHIIFCIFLFLIVLLIFIVFANWVVDKHNMRNIKNEIDGHIFEYKNNQNNKNELKIKNEKKGYIELTKN